MPLTSAKNNKTRIKKVGIITKHSVRLYADFLKKFVEELKSLDKEPIFDEPSAGVLKEKKSFKRDEILRKADLIFVLGGDGTLLKTARQMPKNSRPLIAGINVGHLGFLTGFTQNRIFKNLKRIFKGGFKKDERQLLRVTVYRNGKKRFTTLALNEAVINQGGFSRLINLHVKINMQRMTTFRADGLIISTPTGSTGHSLSAGGPIIHPKIEGFLLTPVCPVKLGMRPIIIPSARQIIINLETQWRAEKKPVVLTIDGQVTFNLKKDDIIKTRLSSRTFNMIRMGGHNYYRMLRQKLNWGE